MRRVILINPRYSKSYFTIPVLPAGLGYLEESLKRHGVDCRIIDMSLGYDTRHVIEVVGEFKPDMVGLSCISYMLKGHRELIKAIRQRYPDVKIIVGGPHVSSLKQQIMTEWPEIDYAVVGDGELPLADLCSGKPPEEIAGLVFRGDGGEIRANRQALLQNLDLLDFPRYEAFELGRYGYKMIGIVTSRGCPYSCIYCSCNVIGKRIRFRSPEHVVSEIDYWYTKGYREFRIQEDNPTFDRARMLAICDLIQKRGYGDLKLMCGNGVRADRIDRELLMEMKKVGFKRLALGIESGSDKVLKAIKKGSDVATMERAIRDATELGFFVSLFFLVGSPGETVEDVKTSIALALKYPVQNVEFFNLVPIPGSELFEYVKCNRYFIRQPEEYLNASCHPARTTKPIFETPEFPRRDRVRMLRKTRGLTRYVKRRAMENMFPRLGVVGKLAFMVYCSQTVERLENRLLSRDVFRKTIGEMRMLIRNTFYDDKTGDRCAHS